MCAIPDTILLQHRLVLCDHHQPNVLVFSKVIDHLRRIEDDGEPMSAASVFSADEEGVLYDLDCWGNFSNVEGRIIRNAPKTCRDDEDDDRETENNVEGDEENSPQSDSGGAGNGEGCAEEAKGETHRRSLLERETRRKTAEAVLAWLKSIESSLAEKCAEVCDAAWYDLGETITFKGRPVAYSIPATVMEAATKRRENEEDRGNNRRLR